MAYSKSGKKQQGRTKVRTYTPIPNASELGISLKLTEDELEEIDKIQMDQIKAGFNRKPMIFR